MTTTDLDLVTTGYEALAPEVRERWAMEQVQTIRNTVGKELTLPEFQMGMAIAAKYDLDPLLHEIWFAKDKANDRVLIMTGRDGFLTVARRQPIYEGMAFDVLRERDEFSVSWENGIPSVTHKYSGFEEERGEIKGAWAIAYFEGKKPTYFFAPLKDYLPTNEKKLRFSPWSSQLSVMIMKCAQSYVLRIGSGAAGLVGAEESERVLEGRLLTEGEGTGEARGVELPPEVEEVIAWATRLGHAGWAERTNWELHADRGEAHLAASLASAQADLQDLEARKAEPEPEDAEVVDPDVPIDSGDLPEPQAWAAGEPATEVAPPPPAATAEGSADSEPAVQGPPPESAEEPPDVEVLRRRLAILKKKRPKTPEEEALRDEEAEFLEAQLQEAAEATAVESESQESLL